MYMKKGSLAFDSHDSTLCLKVKLIRRGDRRLTIMRSLQMYNAKTSSSVLMCAWMFLWVGTPNLSAAVLANAAPSPVPPTDDHGYDYYDYYGDYGDACHNWQTNIQQEVHWEIATVGEQMALRCPFSECWDGYTTTWYRKGVPLKLNPPADGIMQSGDAGEQLQFTQVRQEDAGTYTCQMTNGTHTFVGNIQLEATKPPSITPPSMEPVDPPMLRRGVGENATFVCRASYGVVGPATFPQLYWVKNNTFVNNSSRVVLRRTSRTDSDGSLYMNVRLSIYHLQEADFGQYTCIAHTTFGWTSQNATIENDGSVIELRLFEQARKSIAGNPAHWALSIVVLVSIAAMVTLALGIHVRLRQRDDCKALSKEEKPQDAV